MDLSDEGLKERIVGPDSLFCMCQDEDGPCPRKHRIYNFAIALRDAARAEQREKDATLCERLVMTKDGVHIDRASKNALAAAIRAQEPRHE